MMIKTLSHRAPFAGCNIRTWRSVAIGSVVAGALTLGGCQNATPGQQGAGAGAALGSGIALVTGAGVGRVVGAGLIGGAVGYVGGSAVGR